MSDNKPPTGGPGLHVPSAGSQDLAEYLRLNRPQIEDDLTRLGGLLFRGFHVGNASEFQTSLDALDLAPMEYVYRSTPRTAVSKAVFTATEYPRQQEIPLHNENAYQKRWPLRIAFYCEIPAERGGQTSVADMRTVTARIGSEIMTQFRHLGVRYVRHYRDHVDLPWQTVFQTDSRDELAAFCEREGLGLAWLGDAVLRTEQICQGVARHPRTGEELFFNQAHLFHPSSLGDDAAQALAEIFGADRLPRYATFGDGTEIPRETLQVVRDAFSEAAVNIEWRAGDVALLDNMLMAHGRRPFEGARRVLTSLLEPYRETTAGRVPDEATRVA